MAENDSEKRKGKLIHLNQTVLDELGVQAIQKGHKTSKGYIEHLATEQAKKGK
jgi:hypothetical protein